MADRNELEREFARSCLFVFDCMTPGCDGLPERHEVDVDELTNEVFAVRCAFDLIAESGCGYQLKLVEVKAEGASPSRRTGHARIDRLIMRGATYDEVRNTVGQLLGF